MRRVRWTELSRQCRDNCEPGLAQIRIPARFPPDAPLLEYGRPCYHRAVKIGTERKFTIWTAPASSSDVPALVQLDMRAPIAGATAAKKRAVNAKLRSQTVLKHFVTRTSSESLRKLVK